MLRRAVSAGEHDDFVDDQLGDPEIGDGHHRARETQHDHQDRVRRLRFPNEPDQPRDQWLVPGGAFWMTSISSRRCSAFPTKSMSDALTMSSGPSL